MNKKEVLNCINFRLATLNLYLSHLSLDEEDSLEYKARIEELQTVYDQIDKHLEE